MTFHSIPLRICLFTTRPLFERQSWWLYRWRASLNSVGSYFSYVFYRGSFPDVDLVIDWETNLRIHIYYCGRFLCYENDILIVFYQEGTAVVDCSFLPRKYLIWNIGPYIHRYLKNRIIICLKFVCLKCKILVFYYS